MNKLYGCIIILKRNGEDGSRYPMLKQSCIIGKYVECDIRLHHQEISSKQLLLEIQPKGLLKITNLNPDIKVYVNEVLVVESVYLKSGETFKIINRQFRWEPTKQVSHIPVKRYSEGRTLKMKNKEASNSLCSKQAVNKNKSHIPVFSTKTRKSMGAASKTFSCMPSRDFQVTECQEIKPSIKSSESTNSFQVSNRSRTRKQKRDFESDSNQENISANFSCESDTPKNTTNIELEALKVQHSTAKKTTVRKSLNDSKVKAKKLFSEENVSELEDTFNLSNSSKKGRKSMRKSIKFVEEKIQNKSEAEIFGTPSKDTFHYSTPLKMSKVNAVHSTPIHTEDSILSDDVFKTPKSILKKRNAFSERKKINTKAFNKLLNKSCIETSNLKKSTADYTPSNSLLCSTSNVSTDYNFSNYETPSVSLTNIVSPLNSLSYKDNSSSTNKNKSSTKKSTPNSIRDDSINSLHVTESSKAGSENISGRKRAQNTSSSTKKNRMSLKKNLTNISNVILYSEETTPIKKTTRSSEQKISETKQDSQPKSSKRKSKDATNNLTNVSGMAELFNSISGETPAKRMTRRSLEQKINESKKENQLNSSKRKSKAVVNNLTNVSGMVNLFNSVSGETPAKMEQMSDSKQDNQSKSSKRKSKVATNNLTNISGMADLFNSVSGETPAKVVTKRSLEQKINESQTENQSNSSKRKSKAVVNNLTNVSGMADLFNSVSGETPAKVVTRRSLEQKINESQTENQSNSSKRKSKAVVNNLTNVSGMADLFNSVSGETPAKVVTRRSLEQKINESQTENQSNSSKRKSKAAVNNLTNVSGMADLFNSVSGETPAKVVTRRSLEQKISESQTENQSNSSKQKSKAAVNNLTNVSGMADLFNSVSGETPAKVVTRRSLEQKINESQTENQSNSSKRKSKAVVNNLTNVSGMADLFNSVSGETPAKVVTRRSLEQKINESKKENQLNSSKRKSKAVVNNLTNVSGMADLFNSVSGETPAKIEQISDCKQDNQSKSSKRKSKVAIVATNVSMADLLVSEETPDKRMTRRSLEQIMSKNKQDQSSSLKRKSKAAANNLTNISGVADLFNSVSGETPPIKVTRKSIGEVINNSRENLTTSSKQISKLTPNDLSNASEVAGLFNVHSLSNKKITRKSVGQIMSESKELNSSMQKSIVSSCNAVNVSGINELFKSDCEDTPTIKTTRKSLTEVVGEIKGSRTSSSCKRRVKVSDDLNVSGVNEIFKLDSSPSRKITRKSIKEIINANNSSSSKIRTRTPNNDLVNVSGVGELFKSDSDEVSSPSKKNIRKSIKDIVIDENLSSSQKKTKMPENDLTNVSGVGELFKSDCNEMSLPSKIITRKSVKEDTVVKNPSSQKKTDIPYNDLTNVSGIDELFKSDFENYWTRKNIQSRQKMNKSPRNNSKLPINDLTNVSGIAELFKSNEISPMKKMTRNSIEINNDNKKVGSSKRKTKMPYNDLSNVSGIAELFKSDSEEISPDKKSPNEISINENLNQSNASKRKSIPEIESGKILQCKKTHIFTEQITVNNENKINSSKRKSDIIESDSNDMLQSKKTKKESLKPETSPEENKNNIITILSPQLSKKYSSPPKTALDKSFDSLLGRSALKTYSRSPNKSKISVGSPAQTESVVQWLNEQTDLENKDMFHVDKETGDFISNNVLVTVNNISEVVADLLTNKKHKTEPELKKPIEKIARTTRSRKVVDANEDKIQESKRVTRNKRNVSNKDKIIDLVDDNQEKTETNQNKHKVKFVVENDGTPDSASPVKIRRAARNRNVKLDDNELIDENKEKTETNQNKHKVKFVVENDGTLDLTSPVKIRRTARNRNVKLDDNEKVVSEKITRTKRGKLMSKTDVEQLTPIKDLHKNINLNEVNEAVPERITRTRRGKIISVTKENDMEKLTPVNISEDRKNTEDTDTIKVSVPEKARRTRKKQLTSESDDIANEAMVPKEIKRTRRQKLASESEIINISTDSVVLSPVPKQVKRTRQQKLALETEVISISSDNVISPVPKQVKITRQQKLALENEEMMNVPEKSTMRKRRLYTVNDAEIENLENVSIELPKVNKARALRTRKNKANPNEDLQKLDEKKVTQITKRSKKTADTEIKEQAKSAVSEGRVTRSRTKSKI